MKLRTAIEEKWVQVKRGADEAEFLVVAMTPKTVDELMERATETTWERNQRFRTVDWYAFKILKIDAQIKDWRGIEDEAGEPIPCDRKNKELAYLHNTDLIDEVLDKADRFAMMISEEKAGLEKNSKRGPSGSRAKTE
jgi:hypothetical protein